MSLFGIVGERNLGQMIFLSHEHGEEPEEQQDVVSAVAQWRHLYGNGVEAVVEVFAEASLCYGLSHVHIGSSHDTHVGLAYLLSSHAYIFACLQDAQQPGLCSHGQFSYFVEENGAFVGHTEVTVGLTYSARIRAFLMSEEARCQWCPPGWIHS